MQELEGLPARLAGVASQIVQLRDEMRVETSAIRSETGRLGETLRGEMREMAETLRGEMREIRDELRSEMHGIRDELRDEMHGIRDELRVEIRAGDEETRRYMHVLHEDLVARIALLGETRRGRTKRR